MVGKEVLEGCGVPQAKACNATDVSSADDSKRGSRCMHRVAWEAVAVYTLIHLDIPDKDLVLGRSTLSWRSSQQVEEGSLFIMPKKASVLSTACLYTNSKLPSTKHLGCLQVLL